MTKILENEQPIVVFVKLFLLTKLLLPIIIVQGITLHVA